MPSRPATHEQSQRKPLRVALVFVRARLAFAHGEAGAPPLGLLSLAAYARAARPEQFAFQLMDTYYMSDAALEAALRGFGPDVVALSTLTVWWERLAPVATLVRRAVGAQTRIIAGGPHVTAYLDETLAVSEIDAAVQGEGEIAFVDYLDHIVGRLTVQDVRGLVYRDGQGIARNPVPQQIKHLDDLPMPAYDLLDLSLLEHGHPTIGMVPPPHRFLPVVTSRGCVFHCTFCHHIFGRGWRAMSAERVVDDLEQLVRVHGVHNIDIVDDIFNASPRRTIEICKGIVKRRLGLKLFFPNGLRFDMLDRAQLEAMREAGTVFMCAAFEAASPRMQREMQKFVDIERTLENVAIADELGMFVKGFFIVGSPGETRAEMELTIRTAEASRLHFAHFFMMRVIRGTTLGDQLASEGVDVSPRRFGGYIKWQTNFSDLPDDEIRSLFSSAYRRFWTPRRLLGTIARHPVPENVFRAVGRPTVLRHVLEIIRESMGMDQTEVVGAPVLRSTSVLPPAIERSLVSVGMAGRDMAVLLHERLPRGPVVPPDLRGKVGVPKGKGAREAPSA